MNNSQENKKIASNIVWHFAERWGCQIVAFIITIIISRQIDPDTYGIVTITNAFISIFSIFIDGGLGNALIQKKESDELDFSTVFYTNTIICLVVYILLFFFSPCIASFYKMPSLTPLLRVSGIVIIISALKNIQQAYISKHMMFKKFFFSSLAGTIIGGIVGIIMAIRGYEAWALVFSNITDVIIDTLVMCKAVEWRPKKMFSFDRLKSLWSYGSRILATSIIDRIYNKTYHLSIGKYCSSGELAYYEKGYSISAKISDNTNLVISAVLFPAMSNNQDSKERVKNITQKFLSVNIYIIAPVLMGLIAISEPLVKIVLTEKWLPAVPYLRIFCIASVFFPYEYINNNLVKSSGRADRLLKQELLIKCINIIVLIINLRFGALAVAYGKMFSIMVGVIIKSRFSKELLDYGIVEQIKDTKSILLITAAMALSVYSMNFLNIDMYVLLFIQVLSGIIIYVLLSWVFKIEPMNDLIGFIKKR